MVVCSTIVLKNAQASTSSGGTLLCFLATVNNPWLLYTGRLAITTMHLCHLVTQCPFKTLIAGIELTIGSSTDADIQLDDPSISPPSSDHRGAKGPFLLTDAGSAMDHSSMGCASRAPLSASMTLCRSVFVQSRFAGWPDIFGSRPCLSKPALAP